MPKRTPGMDKTSPMAPSKEQTMSSGTKTSGGVEGMATHVYHHKLDFNEETTVRACEMEQRERATLRPEQK